MKAHSEAAEQAKQIYFLGRSSNFMPTEVKAVDKQSPSNNPPMM